MPAMGATENDRRALEAMTGFPETDRWKERT